MKAKTADNLLNLVKDNYNDIATSFDLTRKKEIWPEVRAQAAVIKEGSKILDVGCGNGRLLEALPKQKIDYLGVDNSRELIKLAKKNYPESRFLAADILDLTVISENNFDYIFCLAVLPHIPSHNLRICALKELRQKLGPGGRIIISAWNLWSAAPGQKDYRWLIWSSWLGSRFKSRSRGRLDFGDLIFPWKNSAGRALSERYYHAFTGGELRRLVRQAGLTICDLKKDRFNYWLILK